MLEIPHIHKGPRTLYYLSRVNVQIATWTPTALIVEQAKLLAGAIRYSLQKNGCPTEEVPTLFREAVPLFHHDLWFDWAAECQGNTKFLMNVVFAFNRELKARLGAEYDLPVLVAMNDSEERHWLNRVFEQYVPEPYPSSVPSTPWGEPFNDTTMGNLLELWMIAMREECSSLVSKDAWGHRGSPVWWDRQDLALKIGGVYTLQELEAMEGGDTEEGDEAEESEE